MNFHKYIFGIIFFFCLLVSPVFAEELNLDINENTSETDIQKQVSGGRDPKDMYLLIYESTKNDIEILSGNKNNKNHLIVVINIENFIIFKRLK